MIKLEEVLECTPLISDEELESQLFEYTIYLEVHFHSLTSGDCTREHRENDRPLVIMLLTFLSTSSKWRLFILALQDAIYLECHLSLGRVISSGYAKLRAKYAVCSLLVEAVRLIIIWVLYFVVRVVIVEGMSLMRAKAMPMPCPENAHSWLELERREMNVCVRVSCDDGFGGEGLDFDEEDDDQDEYDDEYDSEDEGEYDSDDEDY